MKSRRSRFFTAARQVKVGMKSTVFLTLPL
jgi:hypothetical protein